MLDYTRHVLSLAEDAARTGNAVLAFQRLRTLCLSDYSEVLFEMPILDYPALSCVLPRMASDETQRHWTGTSGRPLLQESVVFTQILESQFRRLTGRPLSDATALDFGCGYGRLLRTMSFYIDPQRLYGADPWDRSIEACIDDRVQGQIKRCDYIPDALDFGEIGFDLIFAYSVFTHTSQRATTAALNVLRRYIREGGVLAITIRPIDYWDFNSDISSDVAQECKKLHNRSGFAFFPHGVSTAECEITFGDTSIHPSWLSRNFPEWEIRGYERGLDYLQTILFLTPR